jgi:hypothetical protein
LRCVRRAAIASSFFRSNFPPEGFIFAHGPPSGSDGAGNAYE